jgi:hypothetical protein
MRLCFSRLSVVVAAILVWVADAQGFSGDGSDEAGKSTVLHSKNQLAQLLQSARKGAHQTCQTIAFHRLQEETESNGMIKRDMRKASVYLGFGAENDETRL